MPPNCVYNSADYLSPYNHETDLVRLHEFLNPLAKDGVRIWMKILHQGTQPGKIIPVWSILMEAFESDKLNLVHTLVDSSSGNTALAMASMAAFLGKKAVAVVPQDLAPGKLEPLRLAGTKIEFAGDQDPILYAKELGERPGYFYLNQYNNELNPLGHEMITGEQIVRQTGGKVSVVACGMGTAGTMLGIKRCLRKHEIEAPVVGIICDDGEAIPGMRDEARLGKIGLNWREADEIRKVNSIDAYFASLRLTQAGLPCGPSAGAALWGLLGTLSLRRKHGTLDQLRNQDGNVFAVVPVVDSLAPYWDKVSTKLFPEQIQRQPMPLPPPLINF
jgi:cysteine synthase B